MSHIPLVESYPEDEALTPMIEEYIPMETRRDDFYESFMEQGVQKLNNSDQFCMADSFLFPIESIRTVPTALPQKRISNTSNDSRVNPPEALSSAMPVTPDYSRNHQPYLQPSTSRKNRFSKSPGQLLTVIQELIQNSRTSKNNEPKYNGFQPDHPNSQSVHRTRTG